MRSPLIHCAACAIGPAMLQRTISSVITTISRTCAKPRRNVSRHTRIICGVDVAGIVHHHQPTHKRILVVNRHRENEHGGCFPA